MNRIKRALQMVAVAAMVGLVSAQSVFAQTGTTLPDIGVDASSYVTAFGTKVGGYLATVLGVAFVIIAIRVAMRWVRGQAK